MLTAVSYNRGNEYANWDVKLKDTVSGRIYWFCVHVDEKYHEITGDWNQYIFYKTDPDDMARQLFQESGENFEDALEASIDILEKHDEIYTDEDGKTYCA